MLATFDRAVRAFISVSSLFIIPDMVCNRKALLADGENGVLFLAGDSDGSIDGRRYFTCPRNSGCIVDVAAIRRRIVRSHRRDGALPTDSQALSSLPQSGRANGHVEDVRNSSSATISIEPSRPVEPRTATARRAKSFAARLGERTPVQLSDRIVWLDETGVPRFGQVQWIGHIPDLDEDWMVS